MENVLKGSASLFAEQIEHTIEANLESIIENRQTYTKDGLLYCAICDEPMQKKVKPPINRIVNIDCLCDREAKEEREAKRRREAADNRRKIAFGSANSKKLAFTLQADDRRNPLASQQIAAYCEHFSEHRKDGRGLLLYSVHNGGGKTFFASAAANELIDHGYAVRVTNFADLRDEMTDYKAFGHLNIGLGTGFNKSQMCFISEVDYKVRKRKIVHDIAVGLNLIQPKAEIEERS